MPTIPRKLPADVKRGDYRTFCDYCGASFYRSYLRKNSGGHLACDLCRGGRETTELANAIVQEASKERPRYERDGGRAVVAIDPEAEYVHVTTME
jgi:hypothetical protein